MKQFVIIGIGRFGESIAASLFGMGYDVLAIDKDKERVQYISDKVNQKTI
jgi:trk system potassium uptake protein TrkA